MNFRLYPRLLHPYTLGALRSTVPDGGSVKKSGSGRVLPSRMRRRRGRLTPDSCRLAAAPMSAVLGQQLPCQTRTEFSRVREPD
jgi:hypothetical protein